jgi:hypothetical protein
MAPELGPAKDGGLCPGARYEAEQRARQQERRQQEGSQGAT